MYCGTDLLRKQIIKELDVPGNGSLLVFQSLAKFTLQPYNLLTNFDEHIRNGINVQRKAPPITACKYKLNPTAKTCQDPCLVQYENDTGRQLHRTQNRLKCVSEYYIVLKECINNLEVKHDKALGLLVL